MSSDRRDEYEDDDRDDRRERPHYDHAHRGGMILAFGIVSITTFSFCGLGLIFGLLAWVMGNNDTKAMESGEMDPDGRSLTQAGKICGMIGAVLSFLYLLAVGAYVLFFVILIASK